MDEDETGFVWTFLSDARDPSLIEPGALVVAGDSDAPAVAQVVGIVDKPAGPVVRLRLLPRCDRGLRGSGPSHDHQNLTCPVGRRRLFRRRPVEVSVDASPKKNPFRFFRFG